MESKTLDGGPIVVIKIKHCIYINGFLKKKGNVVEKQSLMGGGGHWQTKSPSQCGFAQI